MQDGRSPDTRLLVLPLDRSLALFAAGRDEPPDKGVIAYLPEAVTCATKGLGSEA
jgi:hypothetical protein